MSASDCRVTRSVTRVCCASVTPPTWPIRSQAMASHTRSRAGVWPPTRLMARATRMRRASAGRPAMRPTSRLKSIARSLLQRWLTIDGRQEPRVRGPGRRSTASAPYPPGRVQRDALPAQNLNPEPRNPERGTGNLEPEAHIECSPYDEPMGRRAAGSGADAGRSGRRHAWSREILTGSQKAGISRGGYNHLLDLANVLVANPELSLVR